MIFMCAALEHLLVCKHNKRKHVKYRKFLKIMMEKLTETETETANEHKKRQRRKKKERKQENIEEVIAKFCNESDIVENLATAFKPANIRNGGIEFRDPSKFFYQITLS